MYQWTLEQWQVKQFVLSESYRAHRSKAASKKFQDFVQFYRLQGHMKSHEKESIHPIALSPNISPFEDETKSPSILICNEKKNQISNFPSKTR